VAQSAGQWSPFTQTKSPWLALTTAQRQWLAQAWTGQTVEETPSASTAGVAVWNGIFAAAAADTFGLPSIEKARTLVEAVKWWQQALRGGAGNAGAVVAQIGGVPREQVAAWLSAAQYAARIAANDPPVIFTWQAADGQRTVLRLTREDAALNIPPPGPGLEYPSSSSFQWRLMQRTNQLLARVTARELGWSIDEVELTLKPDEAGYREVKQAGGAGILYRAKPYLRGSRMVFASNTGVPSHLLGSGRLGVDEVAERVDHRDRRVWRTLQSILTDPIPGIKEGDDDLDKFISRAREDQRQLFFEILSGAWLGQELGATDLPGTMTRLQTTVLINALAQGGTKIPQWMQQGLSNLNRLALAAAMRTEGGYPSLPPALQHDHFERHWENPRHYVARTHAEWNETVARMTGNQWVDTSTDGIYKPPLVTNDSLSKEPETQQMQFFYDRFGAGCVVETLQRLGAGQSVDKALLATTGLTEAQLLAAAQGAQ